MSRSVGGLITLPFFAVFSPLAFGETDQAVPKFEIADVHVSPKRTNAFALAPVVRGGRYEIKNATMVDLVRIAYGFDPDKILGGPNWLELDRFDVVAKVPADSGVEAQKQMLQALLADRFKLQLHKDTKPLPNYVLTAGSKPKLKEADGSGEPGCKPKTDSGPPAEGGLRLFTSDANGRQTTISLGPGMMLQFECRNMTMAAFAAGLRGMLGGGAALGTSPVLDETGLKGSWNFYVKWSLQLIGPAANGGDRVTVFDALEKQLGLKLEQRQNPTPVIVVDSVDRVPSENPAGVAEALPTPPPPKEFEVADVKPADPDQRTPPRFQMQPGGRLTVQGMWMRFLIGRAFPEYNNDQLIGLPKWADTDRFDITALTPASAQIGPGMDLETIAPMLRSLLKERFKMTYHMEERPLPGYALVSVKPKMKKSDPDSRISCKNDLAPVGAPPGSVVFACQNTSMAQFAERLRNMTLGTVNSPVVDATGLDGGWDFTLSFNPAPMVNIPGRGGDTTSPATLPQASDPSGGYTIFEAVEKQLGLKLESQKRSLPVVVIDHIEQKPTDN